MTTRASQPGIRARRRWAGLVPFTALGSLLAGALPAAAINDSDCSGKGCVYAEASINVTEGMAYADGKSLGWTREWSHTAHYRSWVNGSLIQDREVKGIDSSHTFPQLWQPCNGPTTVRARTVAWRTSTGGWKIPIEVQTSNTCNPYDSPIALDLDGSGVIEIGTEPKAFDLDADGSAELLAEWFAGSGDGILYDATKDGAMSGTMLFGNEGDNYPSGYEKLAAWDTNGDGALAGAELDGLALWIDDGNARFHRSESVTLAEAGVVSMALSYDENYASTAEMADGGTILVQDIWFRNRR